MKTCHAAALALVGWYLTVVPTATNAQAVPPSAPPTWHRAEAVIAANQWLLKVPHVKYMTPDLVIDESAVAPAPFWAVGIYVDESKNVREVTGGVPSQLDGVRVFARPIPFVIWCLSVSLGTNVAKECSECLSVRSGREVGKDCSKWCAVTLENEAHSCEKEFKTEAQCESGAVKYVQDWYVDADKNGDVVVSAPTTECVENTLQ
jgi:hypothetical protein